MRALALLAAWTVAGCAHDAGVVEVSWRTCDVTRGPGGSRVYDGGVDVTATLRRGRVERVAAGHYPGACWPDKGALSRLSCRDPHIDTRWVLQWTRPTPAQLLVERLEYGVSSDDNVPDPTAPRERRVLRSFTVAPETQVVAARPLGCEAH